MRGIDTSEHNGRITRDVLQNVDFVIIRLGFGSDIQSQDDSEFENTVTLCEQMGKPWGAYLYGYALNDDDARSEVAHARRILSGRIPPMGVWYDMEDADGYKRNNGFPSNDQLQSICDIFCSAMEAGGNYSGIYASQSWVDGCLAGGRLDRYDKWIAQWADRCTSPASHHLWQFTDCLNICGKNFDGNESDKCPLWEDAPSPAPQQSEASAEQPSCNTHSIGEDVVFSTCYTSSTAPNSEAIPAGNMLKNHGVITYVAEGAANPYLLDNGMCWVNDGDIRGQYSDDSAPAAAIGIGDSVKVQSGACDYDGNSLADFVYQTTYNILELSGDRAVIGIDGTVTAAVSINHLYRV
ncbi:GH25 family lysozyme [Caproicibacterium sp. NSD3]